MKVDSQLPSFEGATEWLNRATPNPPETKGRPTLVHFWSINSKISQANLSHVAELRDQRKREGLRVIAVHLRNPNETTDTQTIREATARFNLTEPCALDDDHKLRNAFLNYLAIMPEKAMEAVIASKGAQCFLELPRHYPCVLFV